MTQKKSLTPEISIVILTFNRVDVLMEALQAVRWPSLRESHTVKLSAS